MPIRIVWPQNKLLSDDEIAVMFAQAAEKNLLMPYELSAKTAVVQAEALHDAYIIRLASDTTKK